MEADMSFGAKLREIREEAGIGLSEMARLIGVTKVYVSDVERGRRAPLSLARIRQVAEILGCAPFDLYVYAVRSRGHAVLPTADVSEEQSRLAAVLSYHWGDFDNDEVKKMMGAAVK
tara:strand:+ start:2851 stop:3201 length:351 start_codon:yes stop_codon:yes gene_type:complete